MTVLSVVQEVAATVGIKVPERLFGNSARSDVEMRSLVKDMAESLAEGHDWPELRLQFSGTGPFTSLPADFDRFALDAGLVNDFGRILTGWRLADSGIYYDGPFSAAYQSRYYAEDEAGSRKAEFTQDSDRFVLPERLLRLGMVWKWKANKGLPYGQDHDEFQRARAQVIGITGSRTAIAVGRARWPRDLQSTWINVDIAAPGGGALP